MKYIILSVQIIIAVSLLILAGLFLTPIITKHTISTYTVMSGSMEPTIPTGGYVFIKKTSLESLKEGSIIAFTNPYDSSSTIVHRITTIEQNGAQLSIHTKGDNNKTQDQWILTGQEIRGELTLTLPYLGYLARFIKTIPGFILFVVLPAIIFIVLQIKQIKEGIHEEIQKRIEKHTATEITSIFLIFFLLGGLINLYKTNVVYAKFLSTAAIQNIAFVGGTTPTITPTPTTPHPHGSCSDVHITISHNGSHSTNEVLLTCIENKIVIQINNTHGLHTVHYVTTYMSDAGLQALEGNIDIDNNQPVKSELFLGTCSSTGCIPDTHIKNKKVKIELEEKTGFGKILD